MNESSPTLSIVMPAYNEARTVGAAIDEVLEADLPGLELIVVDDGSTDATAAEVRTRTGDPRVRLLTHDRNSGKGAAIRTGVAGARGRFTSILDADLEYRAQDVALLLAPLQAGHARAAFGVRAFDGYTSHSFAYVVGNHAVTLAAGVLFNVYLRDLMTCHKAMETALLRDLDLRSNGFAVEAEIAAALMRRGERIYQVPIRYQARSLEEGKKLTATDGFRVLGTLLRERARR